MIWAVSLLTTDLRTRSLTPGVNLDGIRSLIGFGNLVGPLALSVLYLRQTIFRGYTSIYFGENQLSPSLIGLSPLSTGHPERFQPLTVRSSTQFYLSFNLPMDSSLGFGSTPPN